MRDKMQKRSADEKKGRRDSERCGRGREADGPRGEEGRGAELGVSSVEGQGLERPSLAVDRGK